MKLHNRLCSLLLAALLLQTLAGCRPAAPAESADPAVTTGGPSTPAPSQGTPGPEETASPEPSEDPARWDPEHRLDLSFTPAKGLELPVSGATGYATVELPLWAELPEGEEGKLATIYAPSPTPAPTTPTPEPTPTPTPELTPTPAAAPTPQADESGTEPGGPSLPADAEGEQTPAVPAEPTPAQIAETLPGASPEPAPEPSPTATPEPTPTPVPTPEPTPTPEPDPMAGSLAVLDPGTPFTILAESGSWWQVRLKGGEKGWLEHRYCLINLPDVVPSIVYNATNAYSSVFVSSGVDIPHITGEALYHGKEDNPRLGRREFMMPVLYAMAKNVCQAQQNALAQGNTLVLYEGFRPYSTQMAVVKGLRALSRTNSEVAANISTAPWDISWFIATKVSNHQRGYAMDVSLAKVTRAHLGQFGRHSVVQVDEYEEYAMPTPIHELSMASATFTEPVASYSSTAWRSASLSEAMRANQPTLALQQYCTDAKLTPLASEWWHFNDLGAYGQVADYLGEGDFEILDCLSTAAP